MDGPSSKSRERNMKDESTVQSGRVTKIVRVTPAASKFNKERQDLEGYGIIRSKDNREAFFVAASLTEIAFAQLQTGTPVQFTLEPGPIAKALEVWFDDRSESVSSSQSEYADSH